MNADAETYISRAGAKLAAALKAFSLDIRGWRCIDFGSHVGGFVDCLLQHGAAHVTAVEPGYGVLDNSLRTDPRVDVKERTNAMQFVATTPARLITIDVGWTSQRLVFPAARRSLTPDGQIVTLVKPHYESDPKKLRKGVLPAEHMDDVLAVVRQDVADLGWHVRDEIESPMRGHGGNREFLWLLATE